MTKLLPGCKVGFYTSFTVVTSATGGSFSLNVMVWPQVRAGSKRTTICIYNTILWLIQGDALSQFIMQGFAG